MAMGKRERAKQEPMWVVATDLSRSQGYPFFERVNRLLAEHGFDDFVEKACAGFYSKTMGRPSLAPGVYFPCLLVGYFEGISSERGIDCRCADSVAAATCGTSWACRWVPPRPTTRRSPAPAA